MPTLEQKIQFIKQYFINNGIEIDDQETIAKLLLNNDGNIQLTIFDIQSLISPVHRTFPLDSPKLRQLLTQKPSTTHHQFSRNVGEGNNLKIKSERRHVSNRKTLYSNYPPHRVSDKVSTSTYSTYGDSAVPQRSTLTQLPANHHHCPPPSFQATNANSRKMSARSTVPYYKNPNSLINARYSLSPFLAYQAPVAKMHENPTPYNISPFNLPNSMTGDAQSSQFDMQQQGQRPFPSIPTYPWPQ